MVSKTSMLPLGATSLEGRDPESSIRTADVLMKHGIDVRDHASTEGRWRDYEHFEMRARCGARVNLPNRDGVPAAAIMSRKRDGRFRKLVAG